MTQPPVAPAPAARIEWIDLAKGICIFLVVFHHVVGVPFGAFVEATGAASQPLSRLWFLVDTALSPLRVPLFFAISGLLAHRAIFHKGWLNGGRARLASLLWLYGLWATLHWGLSHLIYDVAGGQPMPPEAVNSIYAESLPQFLWLVGTASSSVWYLYALAVYFVVARVGRRIPGLLVAGSALLHLLVANNIPATDWGAASVLSNAVYFMLGCHWGPRWLAWAAALRLRSVAGLAGLFVAGSLLRSRGLELVGLSGLAVSLVSILLLVRVCAALTALRPWGGVRWLGRNTLQVYVLHRPLIDVFLLGVTPAAVSAHAMAEEGGLVTNLWILLFAPAAALLIVIGSLLAWTGTNRGLGRRLYRLPSASGRGAPLKPVLERPS